MNIRSISIFGYVRRYKDISCVTKILEKSFNNGIVIPAKVRSCDKSRGKILCATCNNQINENEDFEATLNLLKQEAPNQFGHMLPFFVK